MSDRDGNVTRGKWPQKTGEIRPLISLPYLGLYSNCSDEYRK